MSIEQKGKYFIKNYELSQMSSYSNYPQSLLQAMRIKSLIGPRGEIPEQDIRVSAFELDPRDRLWRARPPSSRGLHHHQRNRGV